MGLCGFTIAMEDYGLRYPVVEIQHTFYEPPSNMVMQRWLSATPRSLEFTIKAWQLITHSGGSPTYRKMKRPLTDGERATCGAFRASPIVDAAYRRSVECAELVRATAMLFQCPASFAPTDENVANLRSFFRRIKRPKGLRMLWEPRGAKWVAERQLALDLCEELDLVHVVDPFVTRPEKGLPIYWRLHGITGARHRYSDEELLRLKKMYVAAKAPDPSYIMFNEIPRAADAVRFMGLFG